MKVLVSDPIHEDAIEQLKEFADVEIETELSQEEILERVSEFDAMIVRSGTKVNREVLDSAEKLKLIVRAGVGLDNIDLEYADELGVRVENTPEASTSAVSELTVGLMLTWARNISKADKAMKEGKWLKSELVGSELNGKTLGIVGTGRIGCSVAEKAKSFGMDLLGYDIVENDDFKEVGGEYSDMEGLLKKSDYVTLHLPLNSKTEYLIDEEELDLMKDTALLVNMSRGGVVNEDALIRYLKDEEIGGACLDVYESENPTEEQDLIDLDNVVMTPHLGASTVEAQRGVGVLAVEKINKILG